MDSQTTNTATFRDADEQGLAARMSFLDKTLATVRPNPRGARPFPKQKNAKQTQTPTFPCLVRWGVGMGPMANWPGGAELGPGRPAPRTAAAGSTSGPQGQPAAAPAIAATRPGGLRLYARDDSREATGAGPGRIAGKKPFPGGGSADIIGVLPLPRCMKAGVATHWPGGRPGPLGVWTPVTGRGLKPKRHIPRAAAAELDRSLRGCRIRPPPRAKRSLRRRPPSQVSRKTRRRAGRPHRRRAIDRSGGRPLSPSPRGGAPSFDTG